jgi:hypothetical protein
MRVEKAAAVSRRNNGMRRAVTHANADLPDWSRNAYRFLVRFARRNHEFLAEDVVAKAAESNCVEAPPEPRAWGAVIRAAARAGVIRKHGYGLANTSNRSPKVRWRSRVLQ